MGSEQRFPPQIKFIVGNEACERFSYYGMRSILTIFMVSYLGMAQADAKGVYHLFMSACYLLPIIGAWLSDRILGKYRTILFLSLFYCLGHLTLAVWEGQTGLYVGLGLIAMGAGGIKPCVSAYVGDQFTTKNQHLIKKVFDIFYWSINFGSFFAALLIPLVLKYWGPHVAFGIPGILMALALIVFWAGSRQYINIPPTRESGTVGFLPVFWYALTHQGDKKPEQKFWDVARGKFTAAEVEGANAAGDVFKVFISVSMFWALFDQHGSSWVLQAKEMDPNFLGFVVDPSQTQAINPILIMLLIPLFSLVIYPTIERLGFKITPLRRMSVGMVVAGTSFAAVGAIQAVLDAGTKITVGWQIIPNVLLACSEVMVSITGLEFAYTQAPKSMKSTMMSFWFLTIFAGNMLAAFVAKINVFQGASFFYFFALMMALLSGVFIWSASRYRMRDFTVVGSQA